VLEVRRWRELVTGQNRGTLFDRPKTTTGSSANGRRRRIYMYISLIELIWLMEVPENVIVIRPCFLSRSRRSFTREGYVGLVVTKVVSRIGADFCNIKSTLIFPCQYHSTDAQ
jgi:hypothetical protein